MTPSAPAAVLWDLDGTLIDSERYWIDSERALVTAHGGEWTDAHGEQLVGNTLPRSAEILRAAGVDDLTIPEIIDALVAGVRDRVERLGVPWRPGALELLRDLHEAGVPNALVTMSYADNVRPVVAALPFPGFQAVVSGDHVTHGKPAPEAYERAAAALGVEPADTVAFEDSITGMRAAVASGACTVVVPNLVPPPAADDHATWDTLAGRTAADVEQVWRDWSARRAPSRLEQAG